MPGKILFWICFFFIQVLAQDTNELFQSANRLYQNREYNKAIDLYQEIIKEGYEGVSLYYNLGNAYYRNGNIGYAILYYEKALKLAPGDEDIQQNLMLANSRTVDKLPEFPEFFLFRLWENLLGVFSLTGWIYFGYLFFILLLGSIAGYLLFRNPLYGKYSFYTGVIIALIFSLSVAIIIIKLNSDYNTRQGVIVHSAATVKSSPDERSDDSFIVHEGLKIKIEDQIGDWVKVRLNDGKTGWIDNKTLEII